MEGGGRKGREREGREGGREGGRRKGGRGEKEKGGREGGREEEGRGEKEKGGREGGREEGGRGEKEKAHTHTVSQFCLGVINLSCLFPPACLSHSTPAPVMIFTNNT